MTASRSNAAVVDGVDLDAVAAAVRACRGVDDLDSGSLASVVSYLPGRQVAGIRVETDHVVIQVRSRWAVPVIEVATEIRASVLGLVGARRVDIVVSDISDAPGGGEAWTSSSAGPAAPTSASIIRTSAATLPNS